ncbi:Dabb family protein [Rubritalea tangerina]|uniref:Dabb family protein n=1 Tax=Rubritalea tangerina TaxID=430798 RepID=A0ABW4ZC10_9BACT
MKYLLITLVSFLCLNFSALAESKGLVRHVVMFKFKDTATTEQIQSIEKHFASLPKKIDTIVGFEWGTNISKENLNEGLTHCFFVSFKNQQDLDAYGPHPAHQAFVKELKPILDKVVVVDYVAK